MVSGRSKILCNFFLVFVDTLTAYISYNIQSPYYALPLYIIKVPTVQDQYYILFKLNIFYYCWVLLRNIAGASLITKYIT